MTFYHVDRKYKLKTGKVIDFSSVGKIKFPNQFGFEFELDLILGITNNVYNDQFSEHGHSYMLASSVDDSTYIEGILESVRLGFYPDKPSRFQSFFAFGSLQDAKSYFETKYPIYVVEPTSCNYHKGDINLLKGSSFIQAYQKAHLYWRGETSPNPLYEYLLPLPITVKECVYYGIT